MSEHARRGSTSRRLRVAALACSALGHAACGDGPAVTDDAATTLVDAPSADAAVRPRWMRYVRGDVDTRLVIELDAVAGAEPTAAVQTQLVTRLRTLLDKPAGIEIVRGEMIPSRGADHAWTREELVALASETFDDDAMPGTVVMHVLWLDGHDARDSGSGTVLGSAWDHTHIAMFHDTIEASCGGDPLFRDRLCAAAQYGVWLHEVGHTIGLVDNGLPSVAPHVDPAHAGHDLDPDCVMYFAYESGDGLATLRDALLGGAAADFDAACLADLAAARAR